MDHWLEFSARHLNGRSGLNPALKELDAALALRTFLVGRSLTLADLCVWAALKGKTLWLFLFSEFLCDLFHMVIDQVSLCTNHECWSLCFLCCAGSGELQIVQAKQDSFPHVCRWFSFLSSQVPFNSVGARWARKIPSNAAVSVAKLLSLLNYTIKWSQ